jgi:hypothetical protein
VVGNTIIPVRVRSGHGMAILFGIIIGMIGTTLLSWLYARARRGGSAVKTGNT